jgi:hypothetical protein
MPRKIDAAWLKKKKWKDSFLVTCDATLIPIDEFQDRRFLDKWNDAVCLDEKQTLVRDKKSIFM